MYLLYKQTLFLNLTEGEKESLTLQNSLGYILLNLNKGGEWNPYTTVGIVGGYTLNWN